MKRSAFPLVFGVYGLVRMWPEAEFPASVAEGEGCVAGAIVGHDARDGDVKASIVGTSCFEEGDRAEGGLVGHDVGEGDT